MNLWRVVDNDTGKMLASGLLRYEARMIAMGWVADGYRAVIQEDKE